MHAVWGAAGTFARLTAECKGACSLGCCLGWQAHSFEIDCQQLFGACAIVGVFFRYLGSMLMQLLKETKGNPPYGFWAWFKGNHEQCPRFFVRSLILDATDVARSGPIEMGPDKWERQKGKVVCFGSPLPQGCRAKEPLVYVELSIVLVSLAVGLASKSPP